MKGTASLSSSMPTSAVNEKRKLGLVHHGQWTWTAQIVVAYNGVFYTYVTTDS
jgi:hypothetical protein